MPTLSNGFAAERTRTGIRVTHAQTELAMPLPLFDQAGDVPRSLPGGPPMPAAPLAFDIQLWTSTLPLRLELALVSPDAARAALAWVGSGHRPVAFAAAGCDEAWTISLRHGRPGEGITCERFSIYLRKSVGALALRLRAPEPLCDAQPQVFAEISAACEQNVGWGVPSRELAATDYFGSPDRAEEAPRLREVVDAYLTESQRRELAAALRDVLTHPDVAVIRQRFGKYFHPSKEVYRAWYEHHCLRIRNADDGVAMIGRWLTALGEPVVAALPTLGTYVLRFTAGPHRGRDLVLVPGGAISFGSGLGLDVILDGLKIAPLHAVVRNESTGVSIEIPAHGAGPTWVQGHVSAGRQRLFSGAVVDMGQHQFKVLPHSLPEGGEPAPLDVDWLRGALDFVDDRTVAEPTSAAMSEVVTALHTLLRDVSASGCRVNAKVIQRFRELLAAWPQGESIPKVNGPGYAAEILDTTERVLREWEESHPS